MKCSLLLIILLSSLPGFTNAWAAGIIAALPTVIRILVTTVQNAKSIFTDTMPSFESSSMHSMSFDYFDIKPPVGTSWDYLTTNHWRSSRMPEKLHKINDKLVELAKHEETQAALLERWRSEFEEFMEDISQYLVSSPVIFLQQAVAKVDDEIRDPTSPIGHQIASKIDEKIEKAISDSTRKLADSDQVKKSIGSMEEKFSSELDRMVLERVDTSMAQKLSNLEKEIQLMKQKLEKVQNDSEDLEEDLGVTRITGGALGGVTLIGLISAVVSKLRAPRGLPSISVGA